MIVDTATLAKALGISPAKVRKLVHEGKLTPIKRQRSHVHPARGQPAMWFDLDAVLDQRSSGCDSPV